MKKLYGTTTRRRIVLLLPPLILLLVLGLLTGCSIGKAKNTADATTTQTAQATIPTWSPTTDCTVCHQTEANLKAAAETADSAAGGFLAATHMKVGGECMDCHTDATKLASAHEGVTAQNIQSAMPTRLEKAVVDERTCLSSACHNTTLAELAKKTVTSTAITDSKGTVVNPHLAPTLTKAHVEQAQMTCVHCHGTHKAQDTKAYCTSCHHEDVFECGTCHQ